MTSANNVLFTSAFHAAYGRLLRVYSDTSDTLLFSQRVHWNEFLLALTSILTNRTLHRLLTYNIKAGQKCVYYLSSLLLPFYGYYWPAYT